METAPAATVVSIEGEIAKRAAAAGIRLRFDKVAVRLIEGAKTQVGQSVPGSTSIIFAVTAPIRLPAKTSSALQQWLLQLHASRASTTIHGNDVRVRIVNDVRTDAGRVMGFVHNPDSDAELLLEIAETICRKNRHET